MPSNESNKPPNNIPVLIRLLVKWTIGDEELLQLSPNKRLSYKQQYEKHKLNMTIVLLLLLLLNQFFDTLWLDKLTQFHMLFYYCILTLREHVLIYNGSRILLWWFLHHYLSIILIGVILIWPPLPVDLNGSYAQFRTGFNLFSIYLSIVQILQFQYQSSRLYTLSALSRASAMDTTTEASVPARGSVMTNLYFLVPFLIFAQCWQILQGYQWMRLYWEFIQPSYLQKGEYQESQWRFEWHVGVCGLLLFILGTGNFYSLGYVLYAKRIFDLPFLKIEKTALNYYSLIGRLRHEFRIPVTDRLLVYYQLENNDDWYEMTWQEMPSFQQASEITLKLTRQQIGQPLLPITSESSKKNESSQTGGTLVKSVGLDTFDLRLMRDCTNWQEEHMHEAHLALLKSQMEAQQNLIVDLTLKLAKMEFQNEQREKILVPAKEKSIIIPKVRVEYDCDDDKKVEALYDCDDDKKVEAFLNQEVIKNEETIIDEKDDDEKTLFNEDIEEPFCPLPAFMPPQSETISVRMPVDNEREPHLNDEWIEITEEVVLESSD